jgi:putative DNA primase/helicase
LTTAQSTGSAPSGKPTHKNGWYMLHTDGIAAGAFGDWREGFTQNWCSKADTAMTEAERIAHRERVKAMQRQREDDLAQRQQLAAADALKRWTAATPCTQHDYLTRKGIQPHGAKIEGDKLLIPMRDTAGTVHSLQTIAPDGTKMFMSGGRVKGCYFGIGKPKGALIVCEGFATAQASMNAPATRSQSHSMPEILRRSPWHCAPSTRLSKSSLPLTTTTRPPATLE